MFIGGCFVGETAIIGDSALVKEDSVVIRQSVLVRDTAFVADSPLINPRRHKLKTVTRRHKGGGGPIGPLPSTFDTIHPID